MWNRHTNYTKFLLAKIAGKKEYRDSFGTLFPVLVESSPGKLAVFN